MPSKIQYLNKKSLLRQMPDFLDTAVQYEVIMGSIAYGVSNDTSDMDIYGFAIPPRDHLFPHFAGYVHGFDDPPIAFSQFQQHHIFDKDALGGKGRTYDVTIYSIAKYIKLLSECNPNIIDSLFVPRNCIVHSTAIGELLRENRKLFLHKGCWATFKGYAYTQVHKMKTKVPQGKRKAIIEQYGYDVKFAYHVVRLLNEVEQLMLEADLELNRNSEQLKAVRRGEWTLEEVELYFNEKEKQLEKLYLESKLPTQADSKAIKSLLLRCLEAHYGSLDGFILSLDPYEEALREIKTVLARVKI